MGAIIGGIFRRKTELSAFHRIAQGKNDIAFVHIESAGVERGNFSVFVLNDIAVFVFHFHGRNIGQIADAVFPIRRNEKIFISQKCVAEYISAAAFHAVTAVAPIPEQIDDLEIIRVYDGGKHAERIAVSRKRNIRRQFVLVVLDAKIAVVPLVELLHHRLIMVDIIMRGTISDNQLFVIKKDLYGNYADQHNSHNARADLLIPYHRAAEKRNESDKNKQHRNHLQSAQRMGEHSRKCVRVVQHRRIGNKAVPKVQIGVAGDEARKHRRDNKAGHGVKQRRALPVLFVQSGTVERLFGRINDFVSGETCPAEKIKRI